MAQRFYHKASVQVAIVTGIVLFIIAVMHICNDRSQLKRDNENYVKEITSLNQDIQSKTAEIQRLETQYTPFRTIALEKFTGSEQEALRKLEKELQNIRKDVDNLTPFVLDEQFKNSLSSKLSKFIQYEKQNNLDKTNLQFILFQEQTPEASELVRFMRSVFKSNDRITKIAMVVNSRIPPNLQGIIFKVKDPHKAPPSVAGFIEVMKSFNFKICIVTDERMEQNQIGISAQKPSYMICKEE